VKNLDQTQLFPVPVKYPDYQNRINPHIDSVLLGKTKPEKALAKAEKDVEKLKRK
jgi:multiple sugar transport system substrate-binding protein